MKGSPNFQVGDYAICNSFLHMGKISIKTDQMVEITAIDAHETTVFDVPGRVVTLDNVTRVFFPNSLEEVNARVKKAKANDDLNMVATIENTWIDLRAAYACTVNKSQGSTFDKVFIDLDDISRCNSGDQIARMLYVAVSRARSQVILTGDLV